MIKINIKCGVYNSDKLSEVWITRLSDNKCMLCEMWHPGYQYADTIESILNERGFTFDFR